MLDMIDVSARPDGDRLIVEIDPNEPVGLSDLGRSFSALSDIYERNYGEETNAKLYVTQIRTGSVIAELAPFGVMMAGIVATMDSSIIVADFARRLGDGIAAFAGTSRVDASTAVSTADVQSLREFTAPLLGREGAMLGIKRAVFSVESSERKVHAEYVFGETELNRAALNMDRYLEPPAVENKVDQQDFRRFDSKLLLVAQASRAPGKMTGRTGDKGTVPDLFPDVELPLHFAKGVNDLKDKMVRSSVNPLYQHAFIVSGYVVVEFGKPRSILVTDIADVVDIPA